MPSAPTLNQVRAVAAKYASIRVLSDDEVALIAEAVDAGATLRRDCALEDYLNGEGGLPLSWFRAAEVLRGDAQARKDRFYARLQSGDLTPLAYRVVAQRAAMAEAA